MTIELIKIVTLNIQKGWSLGKRKATVQKIKSGILSQGANLVFLQEVVGAFSDLGLKSQFETLADGIWSHYAYGKNAIHSKGHHGNAILSELPFAQHKNFDISNHRFERRGILYGVIPLGGSQAQRLHVMTVHLDLTDWGRARQVEKLCLLIEKVVPADSPLLICGDFNDWREKVSNYLSERVGLKEAHLTQTGEHAKTFPTFFPILKLDRIYFRNMGLRTVFRLDTPEWHHLSDHLGLYAEFSVP